MKKIVIDTNLYVSALINSNSRKRLDQVLENHSLEILLDISLLKELFEVCFRPKFSRWVNVEQTQLFLEIINERGTLIETTSIIKLSPDPKDDFLLALCKDGEADYLLTGNKIDLLDLKQFGKTSILSLTDFLDLNL
ncbi:putative toxin-antitoxin system toxin component, PIN family [Dyadobacter frigoris]|uniref:Putative toxin-antitoxin system toxin component, PIN family n=1 Tax=Dyadobacter frigoris TaxID=2576211 RepID=A0A4U6CRY6_9BACT|nr:putative toxin-antitoxin system toxin component, PIN family [Dyadobacter frigoris]TKT87342.1 putative toxin-antitoxin system toxin component, PIN family [Dyadobacter frigoris]GLU55667.1 PIN domain-containing protein [Dyadobacter frigoris]